MWRVPSAWYPQPSGKVRSVLVLDARGRYDICKQEEGIFGWRGEVCRNKTIAVHVIVNYRPAPLRCRHRIILRVRVLQASRRKVVLVNAHRLLLQGRVDGLRSRASRRCRCRAGHSSCARAGTTGHSARAPSASRDGALTAERWAVRSVGQASRRGPMAEDAPVLVRGTE